MSVPPPSPLFQVKSREMVWSRAIVSALLLLAVLHDCHGSTRSARKLLHEGRGVNMCSKNEERPRMRTDCKSDPACVRHQPRIPTAPLTPDDPEE